MGKSSSFEYARGIENGKRNTLKGWDLGDRVLIKARVGEPKGSKEREKRLNYCTIILGFLATWLLGNKVGVVGKSLACTSTQNPQVEMFGQ